MPWVDFFVEKYIFFVGDDSSLGSLSHALLDDESRSVSHPLHSKTHFALPVSQYSIYCSILLPSPSSEHTSFSPPCSSFLSVACEQNSSVTSSWPGLLTWLTGSAGRVVMNLRLLSSSALLSGSLAFCFSCLLIPFPVFGFLSFVKQISCYIFFRGQEVAGQ